MAASNLGPAAVTTTSKYTAPNPTEKGTDWLLWGGLAAGALLLMRGTSTTSGVATTSGLATTSGSVSPTLSPPGTPLALEQVGGTATSVTVECAMESNATVYSWYSYNTNMLLATSPTNVAVIDGLQTNTGYEVYVVAGNAAGSSPPSQPLLVTTGAGSPIVIYDQNGGGSTTTTAPTLSVDVAVSPQSATLGQTVTVSATLINGPASTAPTVLSGTSTGPVAWAVTIEGPTGTTTKTGAGYSVASLTFIPGASGTYTVTVQATYTGQQASGQAAVTVAAATSGGGGSGGSSPPPSSTPLSVSVSASPSVFVEPGSTTITATLNGGPSGTPAAINGRTAGPVAWTFTLVGGNAIRTGRGSGASGASWSPAINQYGTYTVTATATYAGQTVSAQTNFTAEQPSQATGSVTPSTTKPAAVTLAGPSTATVGQTVTIAVQGASGLVYQFWYRDPFGTGTPATGVGWHSSGGYSAATSFSFPVNHAGGYEAVAYARAATAPTAETIAQRVAYETQSNAVVITVSGSGTTSAAVATTTTSRGTTAPAVSLPAGPYHLMSTGQLVFSLPATYTGQVEAADGQGFYVLRGKFQRLG